MWGSPVFLTHSQITLSEHQKHDQPQNKKIIIKKLTLKTRSTSASAISTTIGPPSQRIRFGHARWGGAAGRFIPSNGWEQFLWVVSRVFVGFLCFLFNVFFVFALVFGVWYGLSFFDFCCYFLLVWFFNIVVTVPLVG